MVQLWVKSNLTQIMTECFLSMKGVPGSILSILKKINVAEVNLYLCLEENGQWLENVDRAHLVLASCKLVLHNSMKGAACKLNPFHI